MLSFGVYPFHQLLAFITRLTCSLAHWLVGSLGSAQMSRLASRLPAFRHILRTITYLLNCQPLVGCITWPRPPLSSLMRQPPSSHSLHSATSSTLPHFILIAMRWQFTCGATTKDMHKFFTWQTVMGRERHARHSLQLTICPVICVHKESTRN